MTIFSLAKKGMLLLISCTALHNACVYTVDIMPGAPLENQGMMNQPFAMPSEAEMEQFIASMPPELQGQMRQGFQELQAMPEEDRNKLFQEVEQQFNYQPSPEELAELERLSKLTPEELDAELRKALLEMGIDPDTGEPIGAEAPTASAPSTPEPGSSSTPSTVSTDDLASVKAMLKRLTKALEMLQLKLSLHPEHSGALSGFMQELADITYYVKIIHQKSRLVTLLDEKHAATVKALSTLEKTVSAQEPRVEFIKTEPATPSAYTILGVERDATDEEISEAFEKLSEEKDPENVQKSLKDEGLSEKELKKALKEAHMSFDIIKDAHETLSDAKLRAQLDRELKAHDQKNTTVSSATKQALSKIAQAVSSAVYQNDLVNALEQFMKEYEPQALAEKKALEDAEKKRKDEQKIASGTRPTQTPGTFESGARLGDGGSNYGSGYPNWGGGYPGWGGSSSGYNDPFAPTPQQPGAQSTSGGQEGAKTDDKAKDDKDKQKNELAAANAAKQEEEDIRFVISELQKDLDGVLGLYTESSTAQLLAQLPDYMHNNQPVDEKTTAKLARLYKNTHFDDVQKKVAELASKKLEGSDRVKQKIASAWRPVKKSIEALSSIADQLQQAILPELNKQKLNQQKITAHGGSPEKPGLTSLAQEMRTLRQSLQDLDQKITGDANKSREDAEKEEKNETRSPQQDASLTPAQKSLNNLERISDRIAALANKVTPEHITTLQSLAQYMRKDIATAPIDREWDKKIKTINDTFKLDSVITEFAAFEKSTQALSEEEQESLSTNRTAANAEKRIAQYAPKLKDLITALQDTTKSADAAKMTAHPTIKKLAEAAIAIKTIV